ncbi:MAG: hypothetical protein RML56_08400 [Burkholderiales bacterium]|nr:hypothetical protein [Burkholderiales bacterium]
MRRSPFSTARSATCAGSGSPDFALEAIPLDDAETYRLLASGNTTAVFQLESRGMRDAAQARAPGPVRGRDRARRALPSRADGSDSRLHPAQARPTERVEYLDPRLEPILAPTYGIMVYQEQVMQIAQAIAGYTLGGADLLRRAMGKKKPAGDGRAARRLPSPARSETACRARKRCSCST